MTKELQDILRIVRRGPGPFALATLVGVDGASYRRPGARLLTDGRSLLRGSLSGGCLEGEILARGQDVLASGRPRLVRYDLRGDADLVWGSGSGCEGMLDILVEPVTGFPAWMAWIEEAWSNRKGLRIRTDLSQEKLGMRSIPGYPGASAPGRREECFEDFVAPIALWILGAGDDSRPLVRLAKELGWTVGLVDHRPAFARPERFPEADAVLAGHPTATIPGLPLDDRSAVVLMTHHYLKDLEALRHLLPSGAGYLGLMGSRSRGAKLLAELASEGIRPDSRFHTPVGLDLGAQDPETIALAILAEVQAALAGRSAASLRGQLTPVATP
ncbi:xanthine dehydrogenase [Geothrix rubra]|uniref:Xanthine dehydrogenase n=1 Tax=Geothrix rubra TaxID=2927977 RepID=A0ABQ5Q3X6_9BACT|nr:XdhC/CoxI family protein [Geothrix rubra]GLH69184.1 xanthine dehydrogenase [Geothrix rubra]